MNNEQNAHDPLVERVLVSFDLAAEHHVSQCEPCQAERERLEDALRQFGTANREYAMRPERFWEQQAARIRANRHQSQSRARKLALLAPVMATFLCAGVLLLQHAPRVSPEAESIPAMQTDSDHELLLAVERAVESDTPQALAPIAWVEEEENGSMATLPVRSKQKESRSHEN